MLAQLLDAKRTYKRIISLAYDTLTIALALYLAISLRIGELYIPITLPILLCFVVTLTASLTAFTKLGLYRAILRYAPTEAIVTVFAGTGISALALASSSFFLNADIPRSSPIIFFLAALILLGAPRLLFRNLLHLLHQRKPTPNAKPIIIYGAGYSGYQLSLVLEHNKTEYNVVGFIDDNPKLKGSKLRGITIYHSLLLEELVKCNQVKTVLLAMGNISRAKKLQIIQKLERLHLQTLTIPAIQDIVSGKASISDIKPVSIEDLLGRDPIPPKPELMGACILGKNVMVTGAGGSIGSELCAQIINQTPARLVLLEQSEYGLYRIEQNLKKQLNGSKIEIVSLIGSVQNEHRLESIMSTFQIQTIYHAAAYKHVPLVEHNIIEGVRNNVFGTWHCAKAAIKAGVESFVLISTDKAVRPTNIMGASKRVAELALQGLAQYQHDTRFTMVRFGNVLGSSGSVVPLFREQIKSGGPITVTHPDIIRYFMTIPEAAELVIQAGSMGQGGDVFVLDMGEPVKILDLAKRMIHLSGLELKTSNALAGDIEIRFSGLRPGEKLYEELLIGNNVSGTEHKRVLRAEELSLNWTQTADLINKLDYACNHFKCDMVRALLIEAPTGYQPEGDTLHDFVWRVKQDESAKQTSPPQLEYVVQEQLTELRAEH